MNPRRSQWRSASLCLAAVAMLAVSVSGWTQTGSAPQLPAHARANGYGGWDCTPGLRKNDETCTPVAVPANGFLTPSGGGWECDRGYRRDGQTCAPIVVPVNAYLDDSSYGRGWSCN